MDIILIIWSKFVSIIRMRLIAFFDVSNYNPMVIYLISHANHGFLLQALNESLEDVHIIIFYKRKNLDLEMHYCETHYKKPF